MPINPEDDMDQTASQTSSAQERGFKIDRTKQDYGKADDDQDNAGDIADEGAGHRDVQEDSRVTRGSAEGERDPDSQSQRNVPGTDDDRR